MDEDDPRALISKYMLHTYNMGLTTTSGGNLSVFDKSGRIFITPGGTDKGVMTPEDIVVVEKDGSVTGGHKPSSELPFHKRIYASNSEFRAVLHAHSPEISAFSAVRVLPDSTIFSGSLLVEKKIVMAEYELTGSEALGEVIFKKFREGADIVVMENHGMISAAKTMREAYGQFEALEFAAHTHRLVNCIPFNKHSEERVDISDEPGYKREDIVLLSDDIPGYNRERGVLKAFLNRAYQKGLIASLDDSFSLRCDDGKILMGSARYAMLHAALYETHPECNAIFLAHPPAITAFCVCGRRIDTSLIPESYMVLQEVGYLNTALLKMGSRAIAENVAQNETLVMLENDGVFALGKTAAQAFDRLEVAEFSARTQIQSKMIGEPVSIPEDKIHELKTRFGLR